MLTRVLKLHLRHFRWEIALFWLLSIGNTASFAQGVPSSVTQALSRLEIVLLVWVTIRLLLAEDGFKLSGTWRIRPISAAAMHLAPALLTGAAVGLPLLIRVLVLARMMALDVGGAWSLVGGSGLPAWLAFAGIVKLFGLLILRGIDGKARTAAWAVFSLLVLIVLIPLTSRGYRDSSRGSADRLGVAESEAIRRALPDATDFIGGWQIDPLQDDEAISAEIVLRIPLDSAGVVSPGTFAHATAMFRGGNLEMGVQLHSIDPKTISRTENLIPILRYRGGIYGTCLYNYLSRSPGVLPLASPSLLAYSATFVSPLALPEFEEEPSDVLQGAELLFVRVLKTAPELRSSLMTRRQGWSHALGDGVMPAVPAPERRGELEEFTHWILDEWLKVDFADYRKAVTAPLTPTLGKLAELELPPQAMPFLFTRGPWADHAWAYLVEPFLLKQATQAELPLLLHRLRTDQRLISVFTAQGWEAAALPVLREALRERIPLSAVCLALLLQQKDPSLTADLMVVALQTGREVSALEPLLREQPGFDWAEFVDAGWKNAKYGVRGDGSWVYANWAAREGDFSAFRHTAEQAAAGKKWELEQLSELVAGEHEDLLAFLRGQIDFMTFDHGLQKWR